MNAKRVLRAAVLAGALPALMAVAVWAGSTGSTFLLMPQGGDSDTFNGDFISNSNTSADPATGLDEPYRYWVEVPNGQTRLRIQLFDPDVGDNDAGPEDDPGSAGRDRCRGTGCIAPDQYDTTVTYRVFNPFSIQQTTSITTGDDTGPSDNTWATLFDTNNQGAPSFVGSEIANSSSGASAPTYIDSTVGSVTTGDLSINVPTHASGDFLLAIVGVDRDGTDATEVTPNQTGWTQIGATQACPDGGDGDAVADCRLEVYYRFAGGSEPASYSWDFGAAADAAIGVILNYRGVDTTTPVDVSGFTSATTTEPTAPTANTTVANTRVVRFALAQENEAFDARPATSREESCPSPCSDSGTSNDGVAISASDASQAAAGATGTAAFSTETNSTPRTVAGTIALRPAASAGATLTIPVPAGAANGDFLLAIMAVDRDGSTTTGFTASETGWTSVGTGACPDDLVESGTAADCQVAIFRRFRVAGDASSYSFTYGTADAAIGVIVAYRGVDTTTPVDDFDTTSATTNDPTAPASSATVANTRVVRFSFAQDNETYDARPATNHEEGSVDTASGTEQGMAASLSSATQVGTGTTGTAAFSVTTVSLTTIARTLSGTIVLRPQATVTPGHWLVEIDMSNDDTDSDDLNGVGVRADDGTAGTGGTELHVYYDSHNQIGIHPSFDGDGGSDEHTYTFYPYITQGCSYNINHFDFDQGNGTANGSGGSWGQLQEFNRAGSSPSFTSTAITTLSGNDEWDQNDVTGFTDSDDAQGYGIWRSAQRIATYSTGGNYANIWFGNENVSSPIPTANPTTDAFRVYFSTDAIDGGSTTAPAKPYLEQVVRCRYTPCNLDPDGVGGIAPSTRYTVTIRVVNPTGSGGSITLDGSPVIVSGSIPSPVTFQGLIGDPTGSESFPTVGSSGAWTWTPGTIVAGTTLIAAFVVEDTTTGTANDVTQDTQMTFRDQTYSAAVAQARSTYAFGPLCELTVNGANVTPVTVTDFTAWRSAGGVEVQWTTDAELGAVGYDLRRFDTELKRFVAVASVPALWASPQGGTYRVLDTGAPEGTLRYVVIERGGGGQHKHGPFFARPEDSGPPAEAAAQTEMAVGFDASGVSYARRPHALVAVAAPEVGPESELSRLSAEAVLGENSTRIRVGVTETGLQSIPVSTLASLYGASQADVLAQIAKGKVQITRGTQNISWFVFGNPVRLFFFGERVPSLYANETYYWLRVGKKGSVAQGAGGGSPVPVAESTYLDTARSETDVFAGTVVVSNPDHDFWFWGAISSEFGPAFEAFNLNIDAPSLRSANGQLSIDLQGSDDGAHTVEARVNGALVGSFNFAGKVPATATFAVPVANLVEGANAVEVRAADGSFYVNRAALRYLRAAIAQGDSLLLPSGLSGKVTVKGLSAPGAVLQLLPDGSSKILTGVTYGPGGATATFNVAGSTRYLALGPNGVKTPASLVPRPLRSKPARGVKNYLVVAPLALADAAESLVSYRQSQGILGRVVVLEDILDTYADGANDPRALRSFLQDVWSRGEKARFMVIVGSGTLDYRNVQGMNDNLVPALLQGTADGLYASDASLGDLSGNDGIPEVAVGRIPVLSAAELDDYVAKMQAYEASGIPGSTLFLTDNDQPNFPFLTDQNRVEGGFEPGFAGDRVDLLGSDVTSINNARAGLFAGWSGSRGLVSFLGHGGTTRLTDETILGNADVASLSAGTTPAVFAWTCLINRFEIPGQASLGEALVLQPNGGAVASWAPSGLSQQSQGTELGRHFGQALQQGARLGDAWRAAAASFRAAQGSLEMLRIYNLLGDPALRLPALAPPPPPSGNTSPDE